MKTKNKDLRSKDQKAIQRQEVANTEENARFWVIGICPELIKWGLNGDNKFPFWKISQAKSCYNYLKESGLHDNDYFYILKLFPNGQMVTIEEDMIMLQ